MAVILTVMLPCNLWAHSGHDITGACGLNGGVIVVVGCKDYTLPVQLFTGDSCLVHALDTDPEKVHRVRDYAKKKGLCGKVSADVFDGKTLPYTNDLVNLVIINDDFKVNNDQWERILTPRGMVLTEDKKLIDRLSSLIEKSQTPEGLFTAHKPVPPRIDDWTHYLYGPGNNAVSKDTVIGPVGSLKWNCGPLWGRSHEFTSTLNILVSAGGRVFYVADEGLTSIHTPNIPEKWSLIARDAFNGKQLWKIALPQWRSRLGKNTSLRSVPPTAQRCIVADADSVYVSSLLGAPIKKIDAATGEIVKTYEKTRGMREFVKVGNSVLLYMEKDSDKKKGNVCRLDLESGDIVWSVEKSAYKGESLAATDKHVIYHDKTALVCLDFDDGRKLWDTANKVPPGGKKRLRPPAGTYILYEDIVLACGASVITAYKASSGDIMWQTKTGGNAMRGMDSFVIRGCLWHAAGDKIVGYDLKTGKPSKTVDPTDVYSRGHHLRCYRAKATENYLITQYRGMEFLSIDGTGNSQTDWARGACSFGVVPANGLMYVPPNPCFCYPGVKITGLNALSVLQENEKPQPSKARLIKGSAYRKNHDSQAMPNKNSWPTYRNGPARHGSTGADVPPDVAVKWKTDLGDKVTPPVTANDKVFVAVKDAHTVCALDAKDGTVAWSFSAGGRVDSPPTIYKGTALFGSVDGYIYCLTAERGELVWKFRAAPAERLIMSFDQLESAWPVHGSVLVKNNVVYCTAGRSSMLDGGIWLYGIEPGTGKVLYETNIDTLKRIRDDFQGKPLIPSYVMEGTNSDILVSEGDHIYMGTTMFDLRLNRIETPLAMDRNHETVAMDISKTDYITADKQLLEDYLKYRSFHRWQEKAWPEMTKVYKAKYGGINLGDLEMGRHIAPTAGFLDDTWFNRTYWMYSDVWPGWYHAHRGAKSGNLLVVGKNQTYALQAYPERNKQSPLFTPESKGYLLLVDDNDNEPVLDYLTRGATKGLGYTRMKPPRWYKWLPVRIRAMVEADNILFAAGPPDVVDMQAPYASFEGRMGSKLLAIDAKNGKIISQKKLASTPVFDGLIAADGMLFMSTVDGSVICMKE